MDPYKPNPMYIFSSIEANILRSYHVPKDYREENSLVIFSVPFHYSKKNRSEVKQYVAGMSQIHDKIIISAGLPSTLTVPHHIHENGSMEEQPGRKGPIRTYFDGSSIKNLGHAVAICIDKTQGTITTQCPKGNELPSKAAKLLNEIFKGYSHQTVRHKQQEDQHSCAALNLRNIFAFAGVLPPQEKVDVMEWRSELLSDLARLKKISRMPGQDSLKNAFDRERRAMAASFQGNLPIYCQPYAKPAPQF